MQRGLLKIAHLVVCLLTVLGVPVTSAQTVKQPWALTVEERIALRTDPRLAADRVRGGTRIKTHAQDGTQVVVDSFDGRTHAELFLPHQVFRTLVRNAFLKSADSAAAYRLAKRPLVEAYGLPDDFWERLARVTAPYVDASRALDAMGAELRQLHGRARNDALLEAAYLQTEACSSRAAALAAARSEFGQEKFDRFLYDVIAVHMLHVADELPHAEDLRQAERGCR